MLKLKTGICLDCPPGSPPRELVAGRCKIHYWQYRNKLSKQAPVPFEQVKEEMALGLWFEYHNTYNHWRCENCGTRLFPLSPEIASSCQAHIIPKQFFRSVQGVI